MTPRLPFWPATLQTPCLGREPKARVATITYVKDEGSNVNTLINALKSRVKCETLVSEKNFQGTCFGHVFSKVC